MDGRDGCRGRARRAQGAGEGGGPEAQGGEEAGGGGGAGVGGAHPAHGRHRPRRRGGAEEAVLGVRVAAQAGRERGRGQPTRPAPALLRLAQGGKRAQVGQGRVHSHRQRRTQPAGDDGLARQQGGFHGGGGARAPADKAQHPQRGRAGGRRKQGQVVADRAGHGGGGGRPGQGEQGGGEGEGPGEEGRQAEAGERKKKNVRRSDANGVRVIFFFPAKRRLVFFLRPHPPPGLSRAWHTGWA
jgi:hypothetical protein